MKKKTVFLILGALSLLLSVSANFAQFKAGKNKLLENRELAAQVKAQDAFMSQQTYLIEKLSEMEAVRCDIQFIVNNKAVFGSVKNGDFSQIAEATIRYLRGEVIGYDTIKAPPVLIKQQITDNKKHK